MSSGQESAFPSQKINEHYTPKHGYQLTADAPIGGLTKREYFAAKAMQALLQVDMPSGNFEDSEISAALAEASIAAADALLAQLAKVKP